MTKRLTLILFTLFPLLTVNAQTTYTKDDSTEVVTLLKDAQPSTLYYARKLLGRPYVAHTLEVNDNEQLIINMRQLDCTTLVETVTALTLCAMKGKQTFADYVNMLTLLRYRKGEVNEYPSRLHYFSDWILDKQKMGIVSELQSPNPPFSAVQKLNLNYMSTHPQSYKTLTAHPEWITIIENQEKELTGSRFYYIPKDKVRNTRLLRSTIQDGDIIAITCSKKGLDIAHLGFAVWKSDGLHLLNASQLHKKVVLEPMTLGTYLSKHPTHTGIRVIRINNK